MGGPSGEHDVSLRSGRGIADALARRRFAVQPLIIPRDLTSASACEVTSDALRQASPEAVFIALHGTFGEDGAVQQVCESLHLPFTGSAAAASRLGMDKIASRRRFVEAGLAVPRWQTMYLAAEAPQQIRIPYPLVVKPVGQGSSLGVSIVRREAELPAALEEAGRYGATVLIEAFVEGREITVGVVGDEALPVIEIRSSHTFFDYAAKYTAGATEYLVPAPLEPAAAKTAQAAGLAAHRALGCRHFSRADLILDRNQVPVVLEVNTIPGFTPTSLLPKAAACAGISYDDLCEQLILMALHAIPHTAGHR